ncbi:hypothetical protein NDI37_14425 [Funiculus sociatus GB2-A5]|uniref:Cation-transporting P-type ATPase N-terminal domain-containing protein n=1 Tax=Funiculus sociatus GB2-A5 TaxID=2933946 RepID=A0ABV0JQE8_9CYAN|nr:MULTISPECIES: hypothetical protein [unclassified Trichocoleus]MBD1905419.1 hypothetical protein [Trichocoleus sp. FACHB-832]MBD2061862.1 hypothetical protein [Trichocoleus sp. FACHB-6]
MSRYWDLSAAQILQQVQFTTADLSSQDAKQRLSEYSINQVCLFLKYAQT